MKVEKVIIYLVIDGKPCLAKTQQVETEVMMTMIGAAVGGTIEVLPLKGGSLNQIDNSDIDHEYVDENGG